MNITLRIFGLWLAGALTLFAAAPTNDVQLTAPARKGSSSLADRKKETSAGPKIWDASNGQIEDLVEIVSVKEQPPEADGRRKVTVRLHYILLHYPKGTVTIGFNLKSATKFVAVAQLPVDAGSAEIELSATITPVAWPKGQPFKLVVSLLGEPRTGQVSLLAAVSRVMKPLPAPAPAK